jgi:hypothetical protein
MTALVQTISLGDLLIGDFPRGAAERDAPFEQAVEPVGNREGLVDVLLDDQHRRALLLDDRHGLIDLTDHDRCEPEGDFVEQQQPGVGHQRPGDGQRLPFASGEPFPTAVQQPRQQRKRLEHSQLRPRSGATHVATDDDVLLHGQRVEDSPALGDQGDALSDPLVGGCVGDRITSVADVAAHRLH